MGALEKTAALKRIVVKVDQLVKNERNPNKMSAREFDLLCDNIERVGITDAILVRPIDQKTPDGRPMYRIVGGHHRYDAACFIGFLELPVTCLPTDFDEEQETFQVVRHNVIHGKLDPQAFFTMYASLSQKYSDEILQDAFGFAEEQEFKRLIAQTSKALPDKGLQKKFMEAAQEVKTIDGLSKLLQHIISTYGDTMPYGYMVFDQGGQRQVWLRIDNSQTMAALELIGEMCIEQQRTFDDLMGYVLRQAAKGRVSDLLTEAVAKTQPVEMPAGMQVLPTKDNLKKLAEVG